MGIGNVLRWESGMFFSDSLCFLIRRVTYHDGQVVGVACDGQVLCDEPSALLHQPL